MGKLKVPPPTITPQHASVPKHHEHLISWSDSCEPASYSGMWAKIWKTWIVDAARLALDTDFNRIPWICSTQ